MSAANGDDKLEGFKCWYASKSMWSIVVGLATSAAALFGYAIKPEYQQHVVDLLTLLTITICFIGAGIGRVLAKTQIGGPRVRSIIRLLLNKEPQ
jgi:hypothetical protein